MGGRLQHPPIDIQKTRQSELRAIIAYPDRHPDSFVGILRDAVLAAIVELQIRRNTAEQQNHLHSESHRTDYIVCRLFPEKIQKKKKIMIV